MVDLGGPTAGAGDPWNRFKNHINNKGSLMSIPLSKIPEISQLHFELNRRITDHEMEPGTTSSP
ncbi:zinc finger protein [Culex quinquefasciatus]|uniref:Zinc finger protein n=1 Tax=Culex quinquefasciatus TaxID=7176 RepID=B0X0W5_CULQU|nr:zinc finger protein [Culex quinquefasciatus]|eukprot:XP_001863287.1 zinc finger protein [Culex quinquefasciatus]